jgi:hypothetical protein
MYCVDRRQLKYLVHAMVDMGSTNVSKATSSSKHTNLMDSCNSPNIIDTHWQEQLDPLRRSKMQEKHGHFMMKRHRNSTLARTRRLGSLCHNLPSSTLIGTPYQHSMTEEPARKTKVKA